MADHGKDGTGRAPGAGPFAGSSGDGARGPLAEIGALVLSVLWLVVCALFFLVMTPEDDQTSGLRLLTTMVVIFLPIAVFWLGAVAGRSVRVMRDEGARLQASVDALREAYQAQQKDRGAAISAAVEARIAELTETGKMPAPVPAAAASAPEAQADAAQEAPATTFTSRRPAATTARPQAPAPAPEPRREPPLTTPDAAEATPTAPPAPAAPAPSPAPAQDQGTLALGAAPGDGQPPLGIGDFIRAMHFPENSDDQKGFLALRRALEDRKVAGLVQAAQDVLTLLSQDGIYMDDLPPERARPEIWRHFADGARGRPIAALGGIRDRSSLALTASRMRQDPVFRDAAHHFLRKFDQVFSDFAQRASDEDIARMADTRTARAFMLLGRVTGTFD